jgi:hypothetical protein
MQFLKNSQGELFTMKQLVAKGFNFSAFVYKVASPANLAEFVES